VSGRAWRPRSRTEEGFDAQGWGKGARGLQQTHLLNRKVLAQFLADKLQLHCVDVAAVLGVEHFERVLKIGDFSCPLDLAVLHAAAAAERSVRRRGRKEYMGAAFESAILLRAKARERGCAGGGRVE